MRYLDLTCPTGGENLACDEALLDWCEETDEGEVLRLYEPAGYFVVLGYSNACRRESRFEQCQADGIPVLRRVSGGGAVLQGPGCLNYSLVLSTGRPEAAGIPGANRFVMERNREILQALLPGEVRVRGHTDLAWNGRKFSGNAQRRRRRRFLFHGTILHNFDLERVDRWLAMPSAEPAYRQGRSHGNFLANIPVPSEALKAALRAGWGADERLETPPPWDRLVGERYARAEWNLRC